MRDIKNNFDAVNSIAPASHTASTNGTGVDLQGYDSAAVVFHVGSADFTDTDEVYTPGLEESDDNVAFSAVAASDLEGALTNLAADSMQRAGYKGNKRYLRATLTVSGTTPSVNASALIVRGAPAHAPVA